MSKGKDIYARLGVDTYINAMGHETRHGGSLMPPEVLAAMHKAAQRYTWLPVLQEACGRRVAAAAGAPAALITSGAAAAILLAVAGCLTGEDRERALLLPRTPLEGPNRVLVWRMARPNYLYQPAEAAGGQIVEVGEPGAPVSGADFAQAMAAHEGRVAAVLLMVHNLDEQRHLTGGWEELIGGVARRAAEAGVPVLVDAAAELPPRDVVCRLLRLGASGVMVSGGKAIRGPQSSGVLFGTEALIATATINNAPEQRIGRPLKVGKEEMCGLTVAVERFFAMDEQAQLAEWRTWCETIVAAAHGRVGTRAEVVQGVPGFGRPPLAPKAVAWPAGGATTVAALATALRNGNPAIQVGTHGDRLVFNPMALQPGDAEQIAQRLHSLTG